jgi:hypothetical protein
VLTKLLHLWKRTFALPASSIARPELSSQRHHDHNDAARERIGIEVFKTWDPGDLDNLVRLMRKFADAVKDDPVKS